MHNQRELYLKFGLRSWKITSFIMFPHSIDNINALKKSVCIMDHASAPERKLSELKSTNLISVVA